MDSINFKAVSLRTGTIKALEKTTNKYKNKKVTLVKLNNSSESDYSALKKLSKLWSSEDNFIETILAKLRYFNKNPQNASIIYLLTSQTKNLRTLKANKILGVAEVSDTDKTCFLEYMQTRPDSTFSKSNRKYKYIGEYLLNFVTKKFGKKNLYLHSVDNAVDFYKKYGFEIVQKDLTNQLMKYMK